MNVLKASPLSTVSHLPRGFETGDVFRIPACFSDEIVDEFGVLLPGDDVGCQKCLDILHGMLESNRLHVRSLIRSSLFEVRMTLDEILPPLSVGGHNG